MNTFTHPKRWIAVMLGLGLGLGSQVQANSFALPIAAANSLYGTANFNGSQMPSQGQLAQMLAPIALYPDTVLTHILISATYPMDVVQAERWQASRTGMSQSQLMADAESQPWDPSVKALLAFPHVLQKMSDELDWTQALGDAFIQDETQVLDAIQSLRQQAWNENNLNDLQNMRVRRVEKHIIIEPVQTQVIYLPYYDTRQIYGHWHWQNHPPRYWDRPAYVTTRMYSGPQAHVYWDTGVHIGVNFFFSAFEWRKRHVVVTPYHNTHYYRQPQQIAISHGAQHWRHEPKHRQRISYSNGSQNGHYDPKTNRRDSHSTGIQFREHSPLKSHSIERSQNTPSWDKQVKRQDKQVKHQDRQQRTNTPPAVTNRTSENRQHVIKQQLDRQPVNRPAVDKQQLDRQPANRQAVDRQQLNRQPANRQAVDRQQLNRQPVNRQSADRQAVNKMPANKVERTAAPVREPARQTRQSEQRLQSPKQSDRHEARHNDQRENKSSRHENSREKERR
jgi:hypothetical protein